MNSIIVSFFNSNNIGDRVISSVLHQKLSKMTNVISLMDFASASIYKIDDLERIDEIGKKPELSSFSEDLCKSSSEESSDLLNRIKETLVPLWVYYLRHKQSFWHDYIESLKKADIVFIGGGNMIMDRGPIPSYTYLFKNYIDIAKRFGKQVYLLNVGAGPFHTKAEQRMSISAVRKCDYSSARDTNVCKLLPVKHVTRDPVFFLDKKTNPAPGKKYVAISVMYDSVVLKNNYQNYLCALSKIVNAISERNMIVLFSTETNDYGAVKELHSMCNKENIYQCMINNLPELLAFYSECELLIGTRMHSLIIAITQGIPTIALSWDKKIESMYDMADMNDCLFPIDTIIENSKEVIEQVIHILDSGDENRTYHFQKNNIEILENEYLTIREMLTGGMTNV